jgi:glycosyltransferase involved in cell wall biosynthesis
MVRASVCMATYNGEQFITEQLDSILHQIGDADEIIVFDDHSTDRTPLLLAQYASEKRLKVYSNPHNLGVCKTFEAAMYKASGKYVVLSDQDDIWMPGRHENMIAAMAAENLMVVTGNFKVLQDSVISHSYASVEAKSSKHYLRNILRIFSGRSGYFGCVMAFDSRLKKYLLPLPSITESHDLWLAIIANLLRSNIHIDDVVLTRKLHGNNASSVKRSFRKKIRSRAIYLAEVTILLTRILRRKLANNM